MKKSTLRVWLAVLVVCLLMALVYVLCNRTTSRDATAEEIAANQAYAVDWSTVPGWEESMTEKAFILNLCSFDREEQIGNNIHKLYSSGILGDYLYRCHELSEVTVMDQTLYVTYYCEDEDMVILAYNDQGLTELCVFDAQSDTLFHEINGDAVIWNKFRGGFQWGK